MSFVQNLRMRNMFPINSDLGTANINLGGRDPMREVISLYNQQVRRNQRSIPQPGIRQVGNAGRQSTLEEPLRFGGVVGGDSNPGAEIMARSKRNAEDLYRSYNAPAPVAEQLGPSNDEIHLGEYFKRKNAETTAEGNAAYKRDQVDSKGWKTVTVTDPNDPSKQINVRHNDITGEVKPIELPGVITRSGSAKDMQANIDTKNLKATQRENIKSKAQESLDSISELMDDKNQLTPEAARAVGKSAVGNWIPTSLGYSGSAKIKKLASQRILDVIGEMKSQTKTGATGFGALNMKELGVLEKAASLLDTGLDEETFRSELQKIKDRLQLALQDEPNSDMKPVSSHSGTNAPQAPAGYEYVRRPDNKGWTAVKKGSK